LWFRAEPDSGNPTAKEKRFMEFIEHTVAWCRGEIFEGRVLALFGAVVVMAALVFWKFGSTPSARAMFIPLLAVGALALIVGLSMNFNNQARIPKYSAAYQQDATAFMESERKRTEDFIRWYPITMASFSVIALLGCAVYFFRPTPTGRAIGLATLLLSLAVLFLDHFSEERAATYHDAISQALEGATPTPQDD
jgi:hypothetical protein